MAHTNHLITTIVFDLGKVLIDWDPRHLYRKMFTDPDEISYFLEKVCPLEWNAELDRGYPLELGVQDRIKLFPEYQSQILAYQTRWEEMVPGAITETVEILSHLRETRYALYALSNWSAETFPLMQRRFEFLNWFERIFISGTVQLIKPNPAFYDYFLKQLNLSARECLFIDDSFLNIQTAKTMGFVTILFKSAADLKEKLKDCGIFI